VATLAWLVSSIGGRGPAGSGGGLILYSTQSEQTVDGVTFAQATATPAPTSVLVGVLIVMALIWMLFVAFLWRGQQWARVLLTVLGVLGGLLTLAGLLSAGLIPIALDAVVIICTVVAMLMMWGSEVTRYVRRPR
jgi:hypothetical protein